MLLCHFFLRFSFICGGGIFDDFDDSWFFFELGQFDTDAFFQLVDNDTLREVPHRSNEGLALQARVSGPWPHKKESVLQVKLALWQGAGTNCCGQSVVHNGELNVQGRKMTRNRTGCCCAEFTINSRNLQIRSNTHKRTRSTGSQEAPGETRKPGQRPRRNAVRPRAAIVPAA